MLKGHRNERPQAESGCGREAMFKLNKYKFILYFIYLSFIFLVAIECLDNMFLLLKLLITARPVSYSVNNIVHIVNTHVHSGWVFVVVRGARGKP